MGVGFSFFLGVWPVSGDGYFLRYVFFHCDWEIAVTVSMN